MENYNEMYLKGKDKIVGLRLAMVRRAEEVEEEIRKMKKKSKK